MKDGFAVTSRVAETACPHCGRKVERVTGPAAGLYPGDLLICFGCYGVQEVDGDGGLRAVVQADLETMSDDAREEIEQVRDMLRRGWRPP
jgi:hypothetical protein